MSLRRYFRNPLVQAAYSARAWLGRDRHLRVLGELDRSQYFPEEQLRALQLAKLRRLLSIAAERSPFWRERFASIGLKPGAVSELRSLEGIPALTKRDIIEQRDRIVVQDAAREELIENQSGGTTGSPLRYFLDRHKLAVREAATLRHNLWTGYRVGDKLATIWGAALDFRPERNLKAALREALWGRYIFLNCSSYSEQSLADFVEAWMRFRPEVVLAYAGGLGFFVRYLEDTGWRIPPPRVIITSAEVLTPENRTAIEGYFGCRVFDRYGCREVSVIASECEEHAGLHVNAENLWLEFETMEVTPDGHRLARLLITDLENQVFPLIRYCLGDVVVVGDFGGPCSCGRTLPRLGGVAGRTSDYLRFPNGRFISGTGLTISLLSKASGVLQTQIVQKSPDRLLLRIVKNTQFDDNSVRILREEFGRLVGDQVRIEFEYPERIEREPSGKYRLAISEVSEG